MQRANAADSPRRSSRLPVTVPILVTSLEPGAKFSEMCETLVVSAHGCSMRSPMRLEAGVPVRFHSREGRETMAHVVGCQPMGSDQQGWMLGVKLDRPENFWGLQPCPEEWMRWSDMPAKPQSPRKPAGANGEAAQQPQVQVPPSLKIVFDKIEKQLSDEHLKIVLAELVRPLNAEVTELKEKLARPEPKRSSFDVSLSHIPPELEEKLWLRLRQELGMQSLQQTREHAAQVLGAAKATIEQKMTAAQDEFRQRVVQELQAVEQRAQTLSQDLAGAVQRHFSAGAEKFHQQVLLAGSGLEQHSQELLQAQQRRLREEHDAYRRDMEEVQEAVALKSSHLQAQVGDLSSRIGNLNESVRRLESELDAHLERLAGEIVFRARTQLESAAAGLFKELQTRGANELANQLDEARGRLKNIQGDIETSVSESLKTQVGEALQSFEQTMEELAQHSVGRWRLALAKDLSSLATLLGQHIRSEAMCDANEN